MAGEVQKVVRSRRRGLKDIYAALITQNDANGYITATPVKLGKAISAKVSDKFSVEKLFSDDGVEEIVESYEGSNIEINLNTLAPQV